MADQYILSIDNGTQSVRALLFDLNGNLAAKAQVHLEAYFSEHPGWAEHDADGYWDAVCGGVPAAMGVHRYRARRRQGRRGDDAARHRRQSGRAKARCCGRPSPGSISAASAGKSRSAFWWRLAFGLARVSGTIEYFRREAEINWIAEHQPGDLGADPQVPAVVGLSELPPVRTPC
jgi:hypothetical protein